MYEKLGELKEGYTKITDMEDKHSDMLQDIGIHTLAEGKVETFFESEKEQAILLLEGAVLLEWNGQSLEVKRASVFEENPWCLHVPLGMGVKVTALGKSEVLVQKTDNKNKFDAKLYTPVDCESTNAGEG